MSAGVCCGNTSRDANLMSPYSVQYIVYTAFNATVTKPTTFNKHLPLTMCLLHVSASKWSSSRRSPPKEYNNGRDLAEQGHLAAETCRRHIVKRRLLNVVGCAVVALNAVHRATL